MSTGYTPSVANLLASIRDDILARPAFYAAGATHLIERYGPDRLHQVDYARWLVFKDHPTEKQGIDVKAAFLAQFEPDESKREELAKQYREQLSKSPSKERAIGCACASMALRGLMEQAGKPHHDDLAKAVCLLAVMLWDSQADLRHPILSLFGPWGAGLDGSIDSIGRWAAASLMGNEKDSDISLADWMDHVRSCWKAAHAMQPVLQAHVEPIALPLADDIQQVFQKTVRQVVEGPQLFMQAALAINQTLYQMIQPDKRGNAPSLIHALKILLESTARETPPVHITQEHKLWIEKLKLLSTLATYSGELGNFGLCGAIPWDQKSELVHLIGEKEPIELPVLGRSWILFDTDGRLRPSSLDQSITQRQARTTSTSGKKIQKRYSTKKVSIAGLLTQLGKILKQHETSITRHIESNAQSPSSPESLTQPDQLWQPSHPPVLSPKQLLPISSGPSPTQTDRRSMTEAGVTNRPNSKITQFAPAKRSGDYTVAKVREFVGLGNTALSNYAKRAGVQTPSRGQRNFMYSRESVIAILQLILSISSEENTLQRCRKALDQIGLDH